MRFLKLRLIELHSEDGDLQLGRLKLKQRRSEALSRMLMYLKLHPLNFNALIFLSCMETKWLWKMRTQKAEMAIPINSNQRMRITVVSNQTTAHNRTAVSYTHLTLPTKRIV